MDRPDPSTRPPPDIPGLLDALAEHGVAWVLGGSYVLTLHGADLAPGDLDVVVRRDPENLDRTARCLETLGAIPFWGGKPDKWVPSLDFCHAWRPWPATVQNLDLLFVTRAGMLDIPFELLPDYEALLSGSKTMQVHGHDIRVSDPRGVLTALEKRSRRKDAERAEVYAGMRRRFGME